MPVIYCFLSLTDHVMIVYYQYIMIVKSILLPTVLYHLYFEFSTKMKLYPTTHLLPKLAGSHISQHSLQNVNEFMHWQFPSWSKRGNFWAFAPSFFHPDLGFEFRVVISSQIGIITYQFQDIALTFTFRSQVSLIGQNKVYVVCFWYMELVAISRINTTPAFTIIILLSDFSIYGVRSYVGNNEPNMIDS